MWTRLHSLSVGYRTIWEPLATSLPRQLPHTCTDQCQRHLPTPTLCWGHLAEGVSLVGSLTCWGASLGLPSLDTQRTGVISRVASSRQWGSGEGCFPQLGAPYWGFRQAITGVLRVTRTAVMRASGPGCVEVSLESEQVSLESEQVSLESEQVSLESEQVSLESEQVSLESEQVSLESEQVSLESEQVSLESEQPGSSWPNEVSQDFIKTSAAAGGAAGALQAARPEPLDGEERSCSAS
ncbi:unnamed protein product [Gadus morhua 'NCC']